MLKKMTTAKTFLVFATTLFLIGMSDSVYSYCSCWDSYMGRGRCLARKEELTDVYCLTWCNQPPPGDNTGYKGPRVASYTRLGYTSCINPQRYEGGVFD